MVKKFLLFGICMLSLLVFSTAVFSLNIDSCQTLANVSGTVYTLTQDVNTTKTCMNIANHSITLDCQSYKIVYGENEGIGDNNIYGINITRYNHSIIKNCNIHTNASGGYGAYYSVALLTGFNNTVQNNTINGTGIGIYISGGVATGGTPGLGNNTVIDNKINGSSVAIRLGQGTVNNTIQTNYINVSTTGIDTETINSGVSKYNLFDNNTIYITAGSRGFDVGGVNFGNTTISNNKIYMKGGTIGILVSDGKSSTISNNKIIINTTSSSSAGIWLQQGTDQFNINSNIIETNGTDYSIRLLISVEDNEFRNNIIISTSPFELQSAQYNKFINNTFKTQVQLLAGNANNNTFLNNTFFSTTSSGLWLRASSAVIPKNNTIYNNIFNTTHTPIQVDSGGTNFNNFSVTSVSGTNIIGGSLLGGNFYANSTVGGKLAYSYTCLDRDGDGICDDSLVFRANDNVDFYPLAAVNDVPVFRNNGTSNSAPKVNEEINISANFTDDLELDTITLEHNASGGALVNTSTKASGVSVLNVSFNLTVSATKNQAVAYKFYVNDTRGRTNSSPQASFIVANTAPAITHQSQFVNLTQHSFNVSAAFNDGDGISDFINRSITYTSGTCNYLNNKTVGTTGLNLTFNCTGTPLLSNAVVISVNDSSLSAVSTTSASNVYPNSIPIVINPNINNTPIILQDANISWDFADLDNDTESGFTIRWFKNGNLIGKANDSRYLTSDNFTTDDSLMVQVNVSDGYGSSALTNLSSSVVVGDASPPLILDNFTSPASVTVGSLVSIYVNVTDTNSDIGSVVFIVTNPNQVGEVGTTRTATFEEGINFAGNVSRWVASYTTTVSGNHLVNVTVTDGSSNVKRSVQGFLNFTVNSATTPGGSSSGGGPPSTEIVTVVKEPFVGCGDNICSEGENPNTCSEDCPLNFDSLVTCIFGGTDCVYGTAWFAQVLIYGLVIGGAYIAVLSSRKSNRVRTRG